MAAYSWPASRQQVFDQNGDVVPGARLQFFAAGTTTPFTVYSDSGLTAPLPAYPDYIEADANARWPRIYMPYGNYRERVRTPTGTLLWDDDGIANPDPEGGGGSSVVTDDQKFTTGDTKWTFDEDILPAFVRMNGRTIGNVGSGATERANDDTLALYQWLWSRLDDTVCPVSGGRGASAATDFAAGKTLALPDVRGRGAFGLDDMGNASAGRLTGGLFAYGNGTTNGANGGAATHTLVENEIPFHDHPAVSAVSDPGHVHGPGSGTSFQNSASGSTFHDTAGGSVVTTTSGATAAATTGITVVTDVAPTGGGAAHNNLAPFMLGTWHIHL